jgi:hypothetical protein
MESLFNLTNNLNVSFPPRHMWSHGMDIESYLNVEKYEHPEEVKSHGHGVVPCHVNMSMSLVF